MKISSVNNLTFLGLPKSSGKVVTSEFEDSRINTYKLRPKKVNLLSGSDAHVQDVAKYVFDLSEEGLREFSSQDIYLFNGVKIKRKKASKKAFERLLPEAKMAKKRYGDLLMSVFELEDKQENGVFEMSKQKEKIENRFLKPLRIAKIGLEEQVPSLIILYGNGDKNKDIITKWLANKSGCITDNLNFEKYADKTLAIKSLQRKLENSKTNYENTSMRTVVVLEGVDDVLQDESLENKRNLTKIKSLFNNASDKYFATIVLKTGIDVNDLPNGVSKGGKVSFGVDCAKQKLTLKEEKLLIDSKKELEELEFKADSVREVFYKKTSRAKKN